MPNRKVINEHVDRALYGHRSLEIPLPQINLNNSKFTLDTSFEESPNANTHHASHRLHRPEKILHVNQMLGKRLNQNPSQFSSYKTDWITQTSLY
jgi:hypothetical protein